jgi:hypothetical protein
MAGFNFSEAAARGYRFSWDERRSLAHYALWPVLLKVATFVVITLLGFEKNLLRQGLMLLPAYFLEGWLIAYAARFAMFGERRPEPLNPEAGDGSPLAADRRRAILAGILAYLLIKLVSALLAGVTMSVGATPPPAGTPAPPPESYVVIMALVVIGVWAFRLFWLHIPIMLDYPVLKFLKRIEGFRTSLQLIGLWIVCMVPGVAALLILGRMLMFIFPGVSPEVPSLAYMCIFSSLQAVAETVVALIANISMAYAVREVVTRKEAGR